MIRTFAGKIILAIYADRMSIYCLGFGIGWTMNHVSHGNFSHLFEDVMVTIIFVWSANLSSRKGLFRPPPASPVVEADGASEGGTR